MQNVIVGTAGHVDHGKTCLIKALSGYDTDRLKEEKKRGITIDLGFANLPNDAGMHIGIIDVPGHEKFVKNMLAGIGGIDLVLMVVSLEEGVMPQTVEHFEILKMLHIKEGIVVLTKCDAVDNDWAELVEADVKNLVEGSFLENAPMIRVSSYTGENINELHDMIIDMVKDAGARREDPELFRLPIDRAFVMEGFGTVITGTLQEGTVEQGQEVMLYPEERPLKIRGIQSHGLKEERAYAGQRTALNLLNIKKEEIKRGDVLAAPGSIIKTTMTDVKITLFTSTAKKLKSGDRVHLNYGSAQVVAKVVMIDKDMIEKGESCYAQLRFDDPIVIKRNDRFIIRFFSPVETFGGGVILDPSPLKHKRHDEAAIESMKIKELGTSEEILELLIKEESNKFPEPKYLSANMDMSRVQTEFYINKLKESKKIIVLSDGRIIHKEFWEILTDIVNKMLSEYHAKNPISEGMDKEEFKSKLIEKFRLDDYKLSDALLFELTKRKVVKSEGSFVSGVNFEATYSDELSNMLNEITAVYKNAGVEFPATADVIGKYKDKLKARQVIADMHKNGQLVKLNPTSFMDKETFDLSMHKLREYIQTHNTITLGEFRDLIGTSRKYAMQILEYLDKQKITKMVGDARVLL